jgi:hypothetical protein
MTRATRERWVFRVELPADVAHGGRFMAKLLKHLLRCWGVRCVAVLDIPADQVSETHQLAQDASGGIKPSVEPSEKLQRGRP